MLWSHLKDWPLDQVYPEGVRRHMRFTVYLNARERDLTGWRFAKNMEILTLEAKPELTEKEREKIKGIRTAIEEIDQVLRWMRNTDWPFR